MNSWAIAQSIDMLELSIQNESLNLVNFIYDHIIYYEVTKLALVFDQ